MKILITGGMGFIGQHLIGKLRDTGHHELLVVDNLSEQVHLSKPIDPGTADISLIVAGVEDYLAYEHVLDGLDVVIHLAAQTGTGQSMCRTSDYVESNVQGTAQLFDALARKHKNLESLHVVLASSRAIYGEGQYETSMGSPVTPRPRSRTQLEAGQYEITEAEGSSLTRALPTIESASLDPGSLYAASKLMQEYQLHYFCEMTGAEHSIFRLQNVYGPGQALDNPYTGVLGVFFNRARAGQELYLFEQGGATRDFVYVSDVVNTLARNLGSPTNQPVNVGTGCPISIGRVAKMIRDGVGGNAPIIPSNRYRIGDIRHAYADVSKLNQLVDTQQFIDFETGVADYITWAGNQEPAADGSERAYAEYLRFFQ